MATRALPHVRVRRMVRNYSSRRGVSPKLVIIHSTEGRNVSGLADLVGLGGWFDNPAAQASSHVAVDAEGNSARYVRDRDKAWTQSNYNSVCLSIENVGFASQNDWPTAQIRENGRWVAYWSKLHGIPIQKGTVSGLTVVRWGSKRHNELGQLGGGHHDPDLDRGDFDFHEMFEFARWCRRRI